MKKIVITGATSFIGVHLLEEMSRQGKYDIYAIIRPRTVNKYRLDSISGIHVVECSLADMDKLSDKLPSQIDVFYHFAWEGARRPHRDNTVLQENNYNAAIKAFSLAASKKCQVFVGTGSQAEYGKTVGAITEFYPTEPTTEYGKYKLKAYQDISRLGKDSGVAVKWPRIFSAYGRYDYKGTLLMSAIEKFQRNEPLDMTDGMQNWNYLYVRDIAKMLTLIGTEKCEDGVYNFASEDNRPLCEYIKELKTVMKSNSDVNFGAVSYGDEGVISFEPIVDKFVKNFRNVEFTLFANGIREMLCGNILFDDNGLKG